MTRSSLLAVGAFAFAAACGGKKPPEAPAPETEAAPTAPAPAPAAPAAGARADVTTRPPPRAWPPSVRGPLTADLTAMIHFDYDKSDIMPEDQANLDRKAAILAANPSLAIQIAGNCDERGSDEYNLALGNRRAAGGQAVPREQGRRRRPDRDRVLRSKSARSRTGQTEAAWAAEPERPVHAHGGRLQPRLAAVRRAVAAACLAGVAACATPAQVQQVEAQVNVLRAETRRSDSASAAQLRQILVLQQQMMDSLAATRRSLNEMKGEHVERHARRAAAAAAAAGADRAEPAAAHRTAVAARGARRGDRRRADPASPAHRARRPIPARAPPRPPHRRSRCTMRRWPSCGAAAPPPARAGLREMLQAYPKSELGARRALLRRAELLLGESRLGRGVLPQGGEGLSHVLAGAGGALQAGTARRAHGDKAGARDAYNQLLKSYPKSDEAALARDRLKALGR